MNWCIFVMREDNKTLLTLQFKYMRIVLSCCKFWIYWMGVNTKFTLCHIVNFVFTPTQFSKFTMQYKFSKASPQKFRKRWRGGHCFAIVMSSCRNAKLVSSHIVVEGHFLRNCWFRCINTYRFFLYIFTLKKFLSIHFF